MLILGKQVAAVTRAKLAVDVAAFEKKFGRKPCLAVIIVGEDPASQTYVRNKIKGCAEVGMASLSYEYGDTTPQEEIAAKLRELAADDNIDAVYIATPHSAHYAYLIDCINHNIPVLTEKSFTVNAAQAKAVFDLAREKKVFVCEAMWTRFAPFLDEVKKWIDEGRIGKIQSFEGKFCMPLKLIKPFVPERVYLAQYAGGSLLDLGVYPISFTHMILG